MELDGERDRYTEFTMQNPELAARVQAAVDKGRAQLEQGFPEEARREFQRALAMYPYVPAALNNLALLAYGEGDRERARAYLEQLLGFSAAEPTANALMARHWLEEGALPLATHYAEVAVHSVVALVAKSDSGDPSRTRRALEFCCQALAELEDDGLLARLYSESGSPVLLPTSLTHVAIAYYNRGHFGSAVQLWQLAIELSPDETAAQVYLEMAEVTDQHHLLPFRLDHRLETPEPENGRKVWLMRVPSLALAAAVTQVYRGSSSEAEESLPLLASIGLPGFRRILIDVANDLTRPHRLRLLAALQLVAAGEFSIADTVVESIPRSMLSGEDEAIWCLLVAMLSEADDDHAEANRLATDGVRLLADSSLPADHPFRQMLNALAEKPLDENTDPKPNLKAVKRRRLRSSEDKFPDKAAGKMMFRLPDTEWLRIALQEPIAPTLEESLARKPREVITELARRLGEQAPDRPDNNALVRRLAMRMRSLPLDRVAGTLSPAARQLLGWLAEQGAPQNLPEVHAWLVKEPLMTDPWLIIEELYRAGLIDIGKRETADRAALQSADLLAVVPVDLCGRFRTHS